LTASVVITGASGFLGRHLLSHFLGEGRDVVGLTRDPGRLDDLAHPRLRIVATDYSPAIGAHLSRSSSVIHLAARRHKPTRHGSAFIEANVSLAERVARAALERGAGRFVYVSTAVILGSSRSELDENSPIDSTTTSAYVRSRAAGLVAVERVASEGLDVVTLLPSIIYGPDHLRAPNRIASHIRRVLSRPLRLAIGRAPEPRNLVFVDDVTNSIAFAERMAGLSGRHLITGENLSQNELELAVCKAVGRPPAPRLVIPRAAARMVSRAIDAAVRFDAGSGWRDTIETLLSPRRFRPNTSLHGASTSFAKGIRMTIESMEGRRR
jgi:nucleoside-diphosphate-sugar epimerase